VTCPKCEEVIRVPVEFDSPLEEELAATTPEETEPEEPPLPRSARVGIASLMLALGAILVMCLPVLGGYVSLTLSAVGLPLGLWGLHLSRMPGEGGTLSYSRVGGGILGGFGTRAEHYPLAGIVASLLALGLSLVPVLSH
jgi:hypothetical protein